MTTHAMSILLVVAIVGVALFAFGGNDDDAASQPDAEEACSLLDVSQVLDRLKGDAVACLTGSAASTYSQVFYTWNAGAISDNSIQAPAPGATKDSATAYSDGNSHTLTISHYDAGGQRVSQNVVSVGEAGVIHVVYQDTPGTDRITISEGETPVFERNYP